MFVKNAFRESGGKFRGNTQVLRKHVFFIVFRRLWVKFLAISIKIGMILNNLSYVSRDKSSGKKCFLVFFSLVNSEFERNCLDFWNEYVNGWKHFLPRVPRTFGEKNFSPIFFFQNFFQTLREKFPDFRRTFDQQGLQNSIFSARGTLWRGKSFSKRMR